MTMQNQASIKDPVISQRGNEKLSKMGIRPPCHVTVVTNKGNVVLSGAIQYEHQRIIAIRAIKSVVGVLRVVDQMHVIPSAQHVKTSYRM
jgi:osmotically-inducible protein OsmY